jgi:hypothetical protein
VVNVYAFRATQPADLWRAADPVGPENDLQLEYQAELAAEANLRPIAAWGTNAKPHRVERVRSIFDRRGVKLRALRITKDGHPSHPLYLPANALPIPWPHDGR